MWRTYLSQKRNLDLETVYVALDLPGYGGSDSLAKYDAYNVLEAVASFILGMRERYGVDGDGDETVAGGGAVGGVGTVGDERGRVVVVSHDWGSVIASRLASEAPQLADHFVLTSAVLVSTSSSLRSSFLLLRLNCVGGLLKLEVSSLRAGIDASTNELFDIRVSYYDLSLLFILICFGLHAFIGLFPGELCPLLIAASTKQPRLWIANAQAHISSVRRMFHTWTQQPLNFRLLRNSWRTLQPIFFQLRRSHYIFAFNLPDLLARFLGSFTGAWFLSKIHRVASYNISTPTNDAVIKEAAEALASSLGPGIGQCKTAISPPLSSIPEKQAVVHDTPTRYPTTVHTRATSTSHGWFQKMRYYRDGLVLGQWTKSLQTILSLSVLDSSNSTLVGSSTATSPTSGKFTSPNQSSAKLAEQAAVTNGVNGADDAGGAPLRHRRRRSSAGLLGSTYASRSRRSSLSVGASLFDAGGSGPKGALRAPATLVVGHKDVAFDWRLGLEGMGDYLGKGGAVVVCENAGHWLVREEVGLEVLRRVVGSAVGSEIVVEGEGGAGSVVIVDGQGAGGAGSGGFKELLKGVEGVKVTVER